MTKILVVKRKHLFIAVTVIAVILLLIIIMVIRKHNTDSDMATSAISKPASTYVPGRYTSEMPVGNYTTTLEVLVDENQVKSVRLINSDESVETMYPLVGDRIEFINSSLRSGINPEELMTDSYGYTHSLIMEQLELILQKAKIES